MDECRVRDAQRRRGRCPHLPSGAKLRKPLYEGQEHGAHQGKSAERVQKKSVGVAIRKEVRNATAFVK
jgi:hypothetical protein